MQTSLLLTALVMGLTGGPHCVAMCGAACAGMAQSAAPHSTRALWLFQVGRVVGYAALGTLAAASMQGLGWLTVQSAALRPVWTLFHVAMVALGIWLVLQARQPVWMETAGRRLWSAVRARTHSVLAAPLLMGMLWALLPCGLLYSALLLATLAPSVPQGGLVMAAFAAGTAVSMVAGPWLWLRLQAGRDLGSWGGWGIRLAGLALAISSAWALWMGLVHDQAPWCLTPATP